MKNIIKLLLGLSFVISASAEQDLFGQRTQPTGLVGNLFNLKKTYELEPTDIVDQNGKVNARKFYQEYERLIKEGFSVKAMNKYAIADEMCNMEFLSIRGASADIAPSSFGSSYIDPKGIIMLYEGVIAKAPNKEFRFAGYFDDSIAVLVNGKLVFYSAWQDLNNLKPKAVSKGRKAGSNTSVVYGDYIRLKKGDKVQVVLAEIPGGQVLGSLQVQLKTFRYKSEDQHGDPVLHPFVACKVDDDIEQKVSRSGIRYEMKRIPELHFVIEE